MRVFIEKIRAELPSLGLGGPIYNMTTNGPDTKCIEMISIKSCSRGYLWMTRARPTRSPGSPGFWIIFWVAFFLADEGMADESMADESMADEGTRFSGLLDHILSRPFPGR
ncbi:unnamed protein product [Cuscuta europaea]|uniref:Uncharacterized protein n=1 Tax=Cuscuta europaea TaxID=41803 RepID=A0A9P0ZRX6_CUSEU|nr:unnamed protein product [Cuscuta europaea]